MFKLETIKTYLVIKKMSESTREVNQSNQAPPAAYARQASSKEKKSENQTPNPDSKADTVQDSIIQNLLNQAGNSSVGSILQKIQPVIDQATHIFQIVFPHIVRGAEIAYNFYNSLPLDIIYALLGLLLVFFGGVYTLLIAAVETFYITGYTQAKEGVFILREEFEIVWNELKKDDEVDEDNDGVADVKQITVKELIMRKIMLFLEKCRDPQQVVILLTSIFTSLISVIAVLKVEFAKVIALGHMIGDVIKMPAYYVFVPALGSVVPEKYHKWIGPIIEIVCKFVAISIAWLIQRVISSVQSAIRGGLMFSRRILAFLKNKGILTSYSEDDYYDEVLGWIVASIGIYFQLSYGFGIPFPINLLLLPLSWIESYLTWVVSN